ncbi:MAG: hypothetical protein ACRD0N_06190 [Acidimicrobiales bacterium]
MAQPEYVPLQAGDRVRPAERLPAHPGWRQARPAELKSPELTKGHGFGSPGPDQGYGLSLAERFHGKLDLAPGEEEHDVVHGCLGVGLRRASLFGRAPVIFDMELAYTLYGYLGGAPADLVAFRVPVLKGAGHDYWVQRDVVDRVAEATLRSTPEKVRASLDDWRSLFVS